MTELDQSSLDEMLAILERYAPQCEVWRPMHHSRSGAASEADIELVLAGGDPLDWATLELLKDAFAESGLSIIVNIRDWHALPEQQRDAIAREHAVIKSAKSSQAPSGNAS